MNETYEKKLRKVCPLCNTLLDIIILNFISFHCYKRITLFFFLIIYIPHVKKKNKDVMLLSPPATFYFFYFTRCFTSYMMLRWFVWYPERLVRTKNIDKSLYNRFLSMNAADRWHRYVDIKDSWLCLLEIIMVIHMVY